MPFYFFEKSNLKLTFINIKYPFNMLETKSKYDIITTVITAIYFKEIPL